VTVSASSDGSNVEIWSGRQQDLFSKYAAKRSKAMQVIKNNLSALKDQLD